MDLASLKIRISRIENLAILPTVVLEILRLFDAGNTSPRSLEKVIEQDPALTAKVLRVAGSSMYGVKAATSISRAVSVLGVNTLRSISISLGYQQVLAENSMGGAFQYRAVFSRHSLAVATGAKAIARIISPACMEEVYVTGLLHDIGILALDRFCHLELNSAMKRARTSETCLSDALAQILGYDQYEVGGILMESWKLAPGMTNSIRFHEDPRNEPNQPLSTAIVIAANYLAYEAGFPEIPGICGHPDGEHVLKDLGLSDEQVDHIKATIIAEIEQSCRMFGDKNAA